MCENKFEMDNEEIIEAVNAINTELELSASEDAEACWNIMSQATTLDEIEEAPGQTFWDEIDQFLEESNGYDN